MDSHDIFVLRGIFEAGYRPRMFIAEINTNMWNRPDQISLLDPTLFTGHVPHNFHFVSAQCAWGASPAAFNALAQEFGYRLVGKAAADLVFIRKDLLKPQWEIPTFDFLLP